MKSLRSAAVLLFFLIITVTLSTAIQAEVPGDRDTLEVIVSATRVDTERHELGSSVDLLPEAEIRATKKTRMLDVLKEVPGIDVVQSGGPGGNTAVFIRGANSEHTLVLIDGIEANNPAATNRSFNFSELSLDNIERIEILRGPQSVLYGSDALGGVVNIITKKGAGEFNAQASTEAGSYETFVEKAGISGAGERVNYSLAFSREDTGGVSAASSQSGNNEQDGYQNTAFSSRIGITPHENVEGSAYLRLNRSRAELDNSGGAFGDDPNRVAHTDQTFVRGEAKTSFFDDRLVQIYGISWSDHDLDDDNDPDSAHPGELLRSTFEGELLKLDLQNNMMVADWNTLTFGIETEEEQASSAFRSDGAFGPFESVFPEEDSRTNGYYLQDQLNIGENFFAALGIRVDDHSRFGEETTWRFAPTYLIREMGTRLKGAYGTGFKAPSLVQLFSEFGNADLEPEESTGWDLGIEQTLIDETLTLGVTYFENEFEELITFDADTFIFENIAEAESLGFETFIKYAANEDVLVNLGYTYTDTEDRSSAEALLRRPRHKVGTNLQYAICADTRLRLSYTLVGERSDNDFAAFPATRVRLGSYGLFGASLSYTGIEQLELFARIDNIFDKEYEDVLGFGAPGLAAYAGVKVAL